MFLRLTQVILVRTPHAFACTVRGRGLNIADALASHVSCVFQAAGVRSVSGLDVFIQSSVFARRIAWRGGSRAVQEVLIECPAAVVWLVPVVSLDAGLLGGRPSCGGADLNPLGGETVGFASFPRTRNLGIQDQCVEER